MENRTSRKIKLLIAAVLLMFFGMVVVDFMAEIMNLAGRLQREQELTV